MTLAMKLMAPLLLTVAGAALAGPPKPDHPCYGVADCKTQGSQADFSACIKANKDLADSDAACASFRKDKDAWLKEHGFASVTDLFES